MARKASRLLGGALLAALSGVATTARAADRVVPVGADPSWSGHVFCTRADIAGTVNVGGYKEDGSGGFLHLHAEEIVIQDTGVISAVGRGYPNELFNNGDATGYDQGAGAIAPDLLPAPGGGGAHYGNGGLGAYANPCGEFPGSSGGLSYDQNDAIVFDLVADAGGDRLVEAMGSAGGSGRLADGQLSQGGGGGGLIILEAYEITLNGQVIADGNPGAASGPAGAGAGGTVIIIASDFTMSPTASCSARGGQGGIDQQVPTVVGGSGGGGRIAMMVDPASYNPAQFWVDGGPGSGGCSVVPAGMPGRFVALDPPAECLDADGDQHPSARCGGDDCDDGENTIYPGAPDPCDGVDQNCSGDESDGVCPEGSTCQEGSCAQLHLPGVGPTRIELSGGCATCLGEKTTPVGGWLVALGLGLGLARRKNVPDQPNRDR